MRHSNCTSTYSSRINIQSINQSHIKSQFDSAIVGYVFVQRLVAVDLANGKENKNSLPLYLGTFEATVRKSLKRSSCPQ